MKNLLICLVVLPLLMSCKQDAKPVKASTPPPAKAAVANKAPIYPKLPNQYLQVMWEKGQMIDYLFHELPFSMNQNEPSSIKTNLTYIDEAPVLEIPAGCKPMARQFYQVDGEIIFEADVYFLDNCKFYVFFVDNKPMYANQMSAAGQQFFTSMIRQAMQARGNIQNG